MKELANGRSEDDAGSGAALMRAVLCRSFDGIDAFTVEDIGTGGARAPARCGGAAAAVGVNFADSLVAAGQYQTRPDFPFSPGFECAGHIDALGPDVKGFEIGERVMAVMDYGAYREQVCVPARACLPPAGEHGLRHRRGLPRDLWHEPYRPRPPRQPERAGETLLVHGAAGGVGLTAVEIGKAMGATVIATAGGPEKLAVALEHGADHGIDYRSEGYPGAASGTSRRGAVRT